MPFDTETRSAGPLAGLRIAVVHDWIYTLGGAERVLQRILGCFPQADVFCLFDTASPAVRQEIGYQTSQTSFIQNLPRVGKNHRHYLPLMPLALEQLDVSQYDIVLSSSFAVAKGIITGPDQLHVSYVHSPMRYAWDLQHQYLRQSKMERGLKGWLARLLLHRLRIWDARTAHGVDQYLCNSHFVGRRIKKFYGREATVLYPPVHVPETAPVATKKDYFLIASRLVQYKNIRVVIEAFNQMPDQQLIVVGDGPDYAALKVLAQPNVTMRGYVDDATLRRLMAEAQAFVFAAEEDFGIVPVETQAAGTPVIALGRGGALETVVADGDAPTGLFFPQAEPAAIVEAVRRFKAHAGRYTAENCYRNAVRFSEQRFDREFTLAVETAHRAFEDTKRAGRTAPTASRGAVDETLSISF